MMSRLFYGSSNVYRNYSRSSIGSDLGLTLIDCTKKSVFDAHVSAAGSLGSNALVISSVLENFVSEVCHGLDVNEVSLFANQAITTHVEALASLIRDSSGSVAFVVPLLNRRVPGEFRI